MLAERRIWASLTSRHGMTVDLDRTCHVTRIRIRDRAADGITGEIYGLVRYQRRGKRRGIDIQS